MSRNGQAQGEISKFEFTTAFNSKNRTYRLKERRRRLLKSVASKWGIKSDLNWIIQRYVIYKWAKTVKHKVRYRNSNLHSKQRLSILKIELTDWKSADAGCWSRLWASELSNPISIGLSSGTWSTNEQKRSSTSLDNKFWICMQGKQLSIVVI